MKSIAVPVADTSECGLVLDTAFGLGARLGARVCGYHMMPEPTPEDYQVDLGTFWAGGGPRSPWQGQDQEQVEAQAEAARKLFTSKMEKHDYSLAADAERKACYSDERGTPEKMIPVIGPVHDLIMVSRPPARGGQKAWAVMLSALFDGGVPVIVLPQKDIDLKLDKVMVAWNNGATEAMLLRLAAPLLAQAGEVVLVTVGAGVAQGPAASEMVSYLADYGVNASCKQIEDGKEGRALDAAAQEMGADLIVSGAYTRGRLREMVFGGVTEHLITKSELPCLLLHHS